jgi:hypothetical protein
VFCKTLATAGMPTTAGMQAKAVTPAISKSKNYSNTVTTRNNRKCKQQQKMTATTGRSKHWDGSKNGMLEKIVKRRPTKAGTLLTAEMTAAAGTIGT